MVLPSQTVVLFAVMVTSGTSLADVLNTAAAEVVVPQVLVMATVYEPASGAVRLVKLSTLLLVPTLVAGAFTHW